MFSLDQLTLSLAHCFTKQIFIMVFNTSCISFLRRCLCVCTYLYIPVLHFLGFGLLPSSHLTGTQTAQTVLSRFKYTQVSTHKHTHSGADPLFWCSFSPCTQKCLVLRSCATPPVIFPQYHEPHSLSCLLGW